MNKYISILLLVISNNLQAQSGFGEAQIIDDMDIQISRIFYSDIDGDGDIDVLASGWNGDTIAWYENLDGLGSFGTVHYIDQNLDFTQSLITADIDGDGDQDVLATSAGDGTVVWYENTNSLGSFSTAKTINNNAPGARPARAADIDNDGDLDIVVGVVGAAKIVWHENLDGMGNFGTENIITPNNTSLSIQICDINGDGNLDVISSHSTGDFFPTWYENLDGLGNFGPQNIISNDIYGSNEVAFADIDGDGDQDVLNAEGSGVIAWYKNVDGLGNFSPKFIITTTPNPRALETKDIDNDGDIDLIATFVGDGKTAWFENLNGAGDFGAIKVISNFSSITVKSTDIDGDEFNDVITVNNNGFQLVWHKNLTYLGVEDTPPLTRVTLYPNPVKNTLQISNQNHQVESLVIYSIEGKEVMQLSQPLRTHINVTNLQNGIYILKIITKKGIKTLKMLKN